MTRIVRVTPHIRVTHKGYQSDLIGQTIPSGLRWPIRARVTGMTGYPGVCLQSDWCNSQVRACVCVCVCACVCECVSIIRPLSACIGSEPRGPYSGALITNEAAREGAPSHVMVWPPAAARCAGNMPSWHASLTLNTSAYLRMPLQCLRRCLSDT